MPILVFIILLIIAFSYPAAFFSILVILIFVGIVVNMNNSEKKAQEEEEKRKKLQKINNIYEESLNKYNIDTSRDKVTYKKGQSNMDRIKQYVWVENNQLCFFPAQPYEFKEDYTIYKIPIKDIEYFATQGKIFRENKITGGGGEVGGSSITGAVVGGVIAGGAGAVIGSRKKGKIDAIKSELITHDTRETFINYFIEGKKHSLFFNFEDCNVFSEIIPEKEFYKVSNQVLIKSINNTETKSISEKIKELNELVKEGLITQEEFNVKKQELLSRI